MRSPKGMLWIRWHPTPNIAPALIRDRDIAERYAGRGWDVEGPFVPGRKHNPMSPRAIRERVNGFRKD